MATREENLKKINEELEMLSDEELDKVAGGTGSQTNKDRKFFRAIGVNNDDTTIDCLFEKFGIDATTHRKSDNEYVFQGHDSYAHHPRHAALGYVLAKINYPGYNGRWWDLDYTRNFIREHISSDVL